MTSVIVAGSRKRYKDGISSFYGGVFFFLFSYRDVVLKWLLYLERFITFVIHVKDRSHGPCTIPWETILVGRLCTASIWESLFDCTNSSWCAAISRREYVALVGSLILIFLEGLITIITLGLRQSSSIPSLIISLTIPSPAHHSLLL